jgi:hypothetical protein
MCSKYIIPLLTNTKNYRRAVEWYPPKAMVSVSGLTPAESTSSWPMGRHCQFFMKVASKAQGKNMVRGEFGSMKAIYTLLPEFTPKPITWGTYETVSDTHFLWNIETW